MLPITTLTRDSKSHISKQQHVQPIIIVVWSLVTLLRISTSLLAAGILDAFGIYLKIQQRTTLIVCRILPADIELMTVSADGATELGWTSSVERCACVCALVLSMASTARGGWPDPGQLGLCLYNMPAEVKLTMQKQDWH